MCHLRGIEVYALDRVCHGWLVTIKEERHGLWRVDLEIPP